MTNPSTTQPAFPELRTARLSLRPLVDAEAEDLHRLYPDPEVIRHSDVFTTSCEEALACYLRHQGEWIDIRVFALLP